MTQPTKFTVTTFPSEIVVATVAGDASNCLLDVGGGVRCTGKFGTSPVGVSNGSPTRTSPA